MFSRRKFLKKSGLAAGAAATLPYLSLGQQRQRVEAKANQPVVISTWNHGLPANNTAWELLTNKENALDAVEKGVNVPERDPAVTSVGYGGLPDRDGNVTLDACIMDHQGNCGSVAFLQHIKTPISVARKVMEESPHIMLVGKGALDFALSQGFEKEDMLTEQAKLRWEEWKKNAEYNPIINIENHDTIGMLALDEQGQLAGACTTSGLAWKMHGRVGDSPMIGAGLFVDGEVGAATATGKGEAVIKIAGTALIVELMRQGRSPQEACEEAIRRIIEKQPDHKNFQVGFLALNKKGQTGAFSLHNGFNYALHNPTGQGMQEADFVYDTNVRTY